MKVFRNALVIFAIVGSVFCVSLLSSLPAAFVVRQVDKRVPLSQRAFELKMATGTVWDGRGWLSVGELGGELVWRATPAGLLRGSLPVALQMAGTDLELQALLALDPRGSVELRSGAGHFGLRRLDPLLQRHGIQIEGDVVIAEASARVERRSGWPSAALARLDWAGGEVRFPVSGQNRSARLPALKGGLDLQGEDLVLLVDLASSGSNLLEIRLQRDLVARIHVRKRLLDELGLPWAQQVDADTIIFRVQQRLKL